MNLLNNSFRILISLGFCIFGSFAGAEGAIPLPEKTLIEIGPYNEKTKTYEIIDVEYYGQGPVYTSPQELAKAVSSLKLNRILEEPKGIVSNQYSLDKVLRVWPTMQLEKGSGLDKSSKNSPKLKKLSQPVKPSL